MPKIFLKPNSAEYEDGDNHCQDQVKTCEMDGCTHFADHKAPKHRGLNEYYHFCMDHVREYNKAWNFFEGMAECEIEKHTINSFYGDRPTWKYGVNGGFEEELYSRAWQFYRGHGSGDASKQKGSPHTNGFEKHSPEFEAMAIMGLEPPVTLEVVKSRYKDLAKKHHPDLNGGCAKSEELLKSINMAYTILKVAYEQFESLPDKT